MKYLQCTIMLALLASCHRHSVDLKAEEAKIVHVWTDWSKKAATGKPEEIAYYFADDALIIDQTPVPVKGKAEMVKVYAAAPTNFEMDYKWEDEEKPHLIKFSKDGDMAYSLDKMHAPVKDSTGATKMVVNKVLHIWNKDDDGNWKVSLLMMSPEQ